MHTADHFRFTGDKSTAHEVHSDEQGPLPSGSFATSMPDMQVDQNHPGNLQSEVGALETQPAPLYSGKAHDWTHQEVSKRYLENHTPSYSTSDARQPGLVHGSIYDPPTSVDTVHTGISNPAIDILPPPQTAPVMSGPGYTWYAQAGAESRPDMRGYNTSRPPSQIAQKYIHSHPHGQQEYLQHSEPFQHRDYGADLSTYDAQALHAKQQAIIAAAHAYASRAGSPSLPLGNEAGYLHAAVPPPPYRDMAHTGFAAHPGPYSYHHLHHHRHYHHYPPYYPVYHEHPQPPPLLRQDSGASSISQASEVSLPSTRSHPTPTQSPSADISPQSHTLHGPWRYPPSLGIAHPPLDGYNNDDGEMQGPGQDETAHLKGYPANDPVQETLTKAQHSSMIEQPQQAGPTHPVAAMRMRRVTRSSTKPYPSSATARSTSSSSASSSRSAALALTIPERTLRSSSVSAAKPANESATSVATAFSRECKPRASKTAAVSRLAAAESPPSVADAPSSLEESIASLSSRPTKKSRGRRPVLTEELKLDNAEIAAQAATASDGDYAFVSDGRAMPVTKEQLEFAGTTKTGRPRMIFICQVPDCGKCFRRAEHLRRHLEGIHSDVKPHACDVADCRRAFARRDNLKQHMKAVHGRKDVKQEESIHSPIAMTAEDIEEMNAAFAGC